MAVTSAGGGGVRAEVKGLADRVVLETRFARR